eukprot:TRINITY_DN26007_c0_g1_i1.p1 TRINITY_DN26007_c0_g1~~TRINITY_DN26007_c0_g1_i1.p1  ORF type:complete len:424 (+),score=90.19 TRINITY_DN26007_c0_g1_i1:178-1272(+)
MRRDRPHRRRALRARRTGACVRSQRGSGRAAPRHVPVVPAVQPHPDGAGRGRARSRHLRVCAGVLPHGGAAGAVLVPDIDKLDAVERECDFQNVPFRYDTIKGANLGATLHLRHILCVKKVVRECIVPRFLEQARMGVPPVVVLSASVSDDKELLGRLGSPTSVAEELGSHPFCFRSATTRTLRSLADHPRWVLQQMCFEADLPNLGLADELAERLTQHYSALPEERWPRMLVRSELRIELNADAPEGTEARRVQDEIVEFREEEEQRYVDVVGPWMLSRVSGLLGREAVMTRQDVVIDLPHFPPLSTCRDAITAKLLDVLSSHGVTACDASPSSTALSLRVSFLPPLYASATGSKRKRCESED